MIAATFFAVSSNFGKVNQRSVSQIVRTSRAAWSGLVDSRRVWGRLETGLRLGAGWPCRVRPPSKSRVQARRPELQVRGDIDFDQRVARDAAGRADGGAHRRFGAPL